jgi:hypothetical protein
MLLVAFGRSGAEQSKQQESELPPPVWLTAVDDDASGNSAPASCFCDDGPAPALLVEETSIAQAEVMMPVARGPLMAHEGAIVRCVGTHGHKQTFSLMGDTRADCGIPAVGASLLAEISIGVPHWPSEHAPDGRASAARGPTWVAAVAGCTPPPFRHHHPEA